MKDVWWAAFLVPIGAGYLAALWSRRRKMGERTTAGITAGGLVGLGYGAVNAFVSPLMPGLAAMGLAAAAGSPALHVLWKAFIFALLAIPGAFLAETRRP